MSAPALRRPARWTDAVRAELVVLREAHAYRWAWLAAGMAFAGMAVHGSPDDTPFRDIRVLVWCMFFLPLAWQGEGGSRRRTARPMDDVTLELVRLACGAVCAALLLGLCIAAYTATLVYARPAMYLLDRQVTMTGLPRGYLLAQVVVGLAHYLFGAAVTLSARRPSRALWSVFLVGAAVVRTAGVGLETTEHEVRIDPGGSVAWIESTSLTLGASLLRLAAAGVAVALAVAAVHVRPRLPFALPNPLRGRGLTRRHALPPPAALRTPRMPASPVRVAVRQFRVQRARMVLPLLMAAFFAWVVRMKEIPASGDVPRFIADPDNALGMFWLAAFLWPVLVWREERGGREWDAANPSDPFIRRLLHAGAGMLWLLIVALVVLAGGVSGAMAAGSLGSLAELPARLWLGLPIALLVVYSLGTVPAVLSERPGLAGIVGAMCLPLLVIGVEILLTGRMLSPPAPLSPSRVGAPLGWTSAADWSAAPVLLWTPLCLALAVGAIRYRLWAERRGEYPSLPELAEMAWRALARRRAAALR